MHKLKSIMALVVVTACLSVAAAGADKQAYRSQEADRAIVGSGSKTDALWHQPNDIATRNLFYGPGGKEHEPRPPFTFVKEELDGTNPKFVVKDRDGEKWKVKLGQEARPETAASRLTWAAGYFADEDYLVPVLHVRDLPSRLKRGQQLINPDGSMNDARLKREPEDEKKAGEWRWRNAPFVGTREFNGLRVIMALINNWDLKDTNNAIRERRGPSGPEIRYLVSDLGASFGTARRDWPVIIAKGYLDSYRQSKFIIDATPYYVNLAVPGRPSIKILVNPRSYFGRLRFRWIGRHIPREDARWIGQLLAHLSREQIRDAFRAAGYGPGEVEGFAMIVENRIAQLKAL
jgi:hypothetical protein